MANRISKKLVRFEHPFRLDEIDEELPAGGYTVETETQDLDGMTFVAHRWIETIIVIRPRAGSREAIRFVEIDPERLEAALSLDRARTEAATVRPDADQEALQRADNEGMHQSS